MISIVETNEIGMLLVSALAGVVLGIIFYGGLWLTLQRLGQAKHMTALLATSLLVRSGLALGGFYLISAGRLDRLAICLATFWVTRLFFIKTLQPEKQRSVETRGNQS
jgi:F1F0 ATPase subunit 2